MIVAVVQSTWCLHTQPDGSPPPPTPEGSPALSLKLTAACSSAHSLRGAGDGQPGHQTAVVGQQQARARRKRDC